MINTFRLIKNNIKEAYDDVEVFETKIINFKNINPLFEYELNIIRDKDDKWNVIVKLWDDEQDKKRIYRTDVDILIRV